MANGPREVPMRRDTTIATSTNRAGRLVLAAALGGVLLLAAAPRAAAATTALVRFPALNGNRIVFEAAGDLWTVDRSGGVARRLTADRGYDMMPRFSPDGKTIAFTGQYDGGTDVYVIPAGGGEARRLTYHSDVVKSAPMRWGPDDMVVTWTPDGSSVVFLSRRDTYNSWFGRLFAVAATGGLPTRLPLPKGGVLSYSPDGTKIAYNRIFRNFRTWKRYDGGLAQDIWIYDLHSHAIERVTHWKGTDTYPMWYGDTIYFASDRDANRRMNIWAYSLEDKTFRQVTHFTDYDIDWPSLGNDGIVFAEGGDLYVLDLPSEQLHKVEVTVPDDGVQTRPRWENVSKRIEDMDIAPNGQRALFTARGEVLTVPRKHGNTRDLTRTPGARERGAVWSPDGTEVAYVTDASGQDQIAVRPADGTGAETVLTARTAGYLEELRWSPDGTRIAFSDSDHVLWYVTVASRKVVRVDKDPWAEMGDYVWSPHGGWLAYSKGQPNNFRRLYLYNLASGRTVALGDGMTSDSEPVFDPDGRYLFFISARHPNPVFSQTEFNEATLKMGGIYAATLRPGLPSPFAPRSDEGVVTKKKSEEASGKGKTTATATAPPKP
ncbi:MAG TPA: protease, partial [Polyangiaceae bacterium]|nr:protease [Polyangiaceae bacterium]